MAQRILQGFKTRILIELPQYKKEILKDLNADMLVYSSLFKNEQITEQEYLIELLRLSPKIRLLTHDLTL